MLVDWHCVVFSSPIRILSFLFFCLLPGQRVDKGVARSVLHLLEHVVEKERIQMSDLVSDELLFNIHAVS